MLHTCTDIQRILSSEKRSCVNIRPCCPLTFLCIHHPDTGVLLCNCRRVDQSQELNIKAVLFHLLPQSRNVLFFSTFFLYSLRIQSSITYCIQLTCFFKLLQQGTVPQLFIKLTFSKNKGQLFYRLSFSLGLSDFSLSLGLEYALKAGKPMWDCVLRVSYLEAHRSVCADYQCQFSSPG